MTSPQPRPNPYVGPRAFQTGEKIYGRDREVRELLDLLIAERIVVLYSPSGAGKSSLIYAGLTPALEQEGFRILPVIRVNLEPPPDIPKDDHFNRYVFSALMALEEDLEEDQHTESAELASMTLAEYLANCPREEGAPENEVLIFDQFEEILTLNPTDRQGKQDFFDQLGAALRNRNRWALFSLREDYLASLDPYLRPIPTRFSNKFRLDLLGRNAARQAIQQPARGAGVEFADSAASKLIDDLRRVLEQQPDGTMQERLGPYVEPVQLQVVCYRLWNNLLPEETQITEEHLATVGDVDQSLAGYYAEKVEEIAAQTRVSERAIRGWMERQLITEGGFRGQVLMGEGGSEGLDNRAVFLLLDAHLIRGEKRRGATWFELAHDRLINPVRRDNATWTQAHLSTLQIQATLWEQQDRSETLYLRDQALKEAEEWAAEHPEELNETDREFLEACLELRAREEEARAAKEREEQLKLEAAQKVAEAERQRAEEQAKSATRLRRRAYILGIVLIIALALAGLAFLSYREAQAQREVAVTQRSAAEAASKLAEENEAIAEANAAEAADNASTAEAASILANQNAATAEAASERAREQRATAVYNAQVAQTQEAIAVAQAKLARSRELASAALTFLRNNSTLNLLLSKEALDISETGQALDAILRGLQYNLGRQAERYDQVIPPQTIEIFAASASPDGNHIAWAGAAGEIVVWDLVEEEEAWRKIATGATINTIAYSRDGSFIAIGDDAGGLSLLDSETGDRIRNFQSNIQRINVLAISQDGSTIAYGGVNAGTSANIYTRNLETGVVQDFRIREGEVAEVLALAWSPDGNLLVSGGRDRIVHLWDPETGREEDRLVNWVVDNQFEFIFQGPIRSLAFSPNGKWLVTGAEDNVGVPDRDLLAWDTTAWEEEDPRTFFGPQRTLRSMRFSPDGQTLVSGYENGEVVVWNFNNQQPNEPLKDHTRTVTDLAFAQFEESLLLVSVSLDRNVILNNLIAPQSLDIPLSEGKGDSPRLAVASDVQPRIAGNTGDELVIWGLDPLSGSEAQLAQVPLVSDGDYQLSVDGTHLAMIEPGEGILVLDLNSGQEVITIDLPSTTVTTVNAAGESSSSEEPASIDSLAFNPDNTILAGSYCGERRITVDPETDQESRTCLHNDIVLWQVTTGETEEHIITDQSSTILSLAFDPLDENLLAVGYQNGIIQFCDLSQGGAAGLPLVGSGGPITSLAYHREGDVLVSGTDNNLIALWNLNPPQLIGDPMVGAKGSVTSLALGEDHSRLYSATDQGNIQLWDLDNWKEIACEIAGRNLYPNEWEQFFPDQDYRATCGQLPTGTPEPTPQVTATPTP